MDNQNIILGGIFILFCIICVIFVPQKKHLFKPNHFNHKPLQKTI